MQSWKICQHLQENTCVRVTFFHKASQEVLLNIDYDEPQATVV